MSNRQDKPMANPAVNWTLRGKAEQRPVTSTLAA